MQNICYSSLQANFAVWSFFMISARLHINTFYAIGLFLYTLNTPAYLIFTNFQTSMM